MKIMIIGCGRVGARMAQRMEKGGHEISVIDVDREAFSSLGGDFQGPTYHGSGLDIPTLKRAGVSDMDSIIAVTGGDNRNLMIVQITKHEFGKQKAIARIKDPIRAAKYREMGVETLCVTTIIEGMLELWAENGEFPALPEVMPVYGDASALND